MKICFISTGYLPVTSKGGAIEKLMELYLDYNEKIKDNIAVYTIKTKSEEEKKSYLYTKFIVIDKTKVAFKISRAFFGLLNKIVPRPIANAYIRSVVKEFKKRKENYDLIVFENGVDFIPYFRKKTRTKSKIVLHLHNDYLNKDTKNKNQIIDNINEVWTVSNFIKNRVLEINSQVNVKVLYNAVDSSLFNKSCSCDEIITLKSRLKIKDEFVILYTGKLMREKGVKELITAFINLNQKIKNIKLIIIGDSKIRNKKDDYFLSLKKIANNNVIFTGFIKPEDLYKYYKISHVQVVPSTWNEAFGLTVLEGIINNIPLIVSNNGGIPEIVGNRGIYVSTKNIVKELEITIEKIINLSEEERNNLMLDYELIRNKYSLENYYNNLNNLLK